MGCGFLSAALIVMSILVYCECRAAVLSASSASAYTAKDSRAVTQTCEVGVSKCPTNEKCIPRSSHGKLGTCECEPGFERSDDGNCLQEIDAEDGELYETDYTESEESDENDADGANLVEEIRAVEPDYTEAEEADENDADGTVLATGIRPVEPNYTEAEEADENEADGTRLAEEIRKTDEPDGLDEITEVSPVDRSESIQVANTCEFGVEFCGKNEICQLRNSRSKMGMCVCADGFERNTDNVCEQLEQSEASVPQVDSASNQQHVEQNTTGKPPAEYSTTDFALVKSNMANITDETMKSPEVAVAPVHADAGPDVVVSAPHTLIAIDGRGRSHDSIVQYTWHRAESSLASGRILNASEQQQTLLFLPFSTGTYEFVLTVQNSAGATAHDNVRVIVNDTIGRFAMTMRLAGAAYRFTEADRRGLETQIELLLSKPSTIANVRAQVSISTVTEQIVDSSMLVEFSVHFVQSESSSTSESSSSHTGMWADVASGNEADHVADPRWLVDYLEAKLEEQRYHLLDFDVLQVGPKYCAEPFISTHAKNVTFLSRCGAHATCVDERRCVCEDFWLPNPMRRLRAHCEVNVFVAILVPVAALIALIGFIALCVRLCCPTRRSLEERVNERMSRRERSRREAKRLIRMPGARKRSFDGKTASMNNLFDSDDNYEAESDDEVVKLQRGPLNRLTSGSHSDLPGAEVTPFVNDNVNVGVKSGMNLTSDKSGSKVKA